MPAMNKDMYADEATQRNLRALKERGCIIIEPDEGMLACGDTGKGRMQEPREIVAQVEKLLYPKRDLEGKTVLITAGATREDIDTVRFISNRSSGKMGISLAQAAIERAKVVLIAANISVEAPKQAEIIKVNTTQQMYEAVISKMEKADIIIKAAAPADYRVKQKSSQKIKAETLSLELEKNADIAAEAGKRKGDKKLVVFAAESENLLRNAAQKLKKKNADMIVANDITKEGAGFDTDTNIVTIIKADGQMKSLPLMTKRELSDIILDEILK